MNKTSVKPSKLPNIVQQKAKKFENPDPYHFPLSKSSKDVNIVQTVTSFTHNISFFFKIATAFYVLKNGTF